MHRIDPINREQAMAVLLDFCHYMQSMAWFPQKSFFSSSLGLDEWLAQ